MHTKNFTNYELYVDFIAIDSYSVINAMQKIKYLVLREGVFGRTDSQCHTVVLREPLHGFIPYNLIYTYFISGTRSVFAHMYWR